MNRCVQCLRCVRYCDEVMDVKALAPVGRGTMTEIKHFGTHELDCEFCGRCVQICPVGKITNIANLSTHDFAGHPDQFGMMVLALIKAVMDEHLIDAGLAQRAPAY